MRQTITVTMQSLEKTKNMEPSVCSGEGACLKRLCHCELLRTELQRDHSGSHCQASSTLNYSWESTVQKLCQAPEENASGPEIHSELPGPKDQTLGIFILLGATSGSVAKRWAYFWLSVSASLTLGVRESYLNLKIIWGLAPTNVRKTPGRGQSLIHRPQSVRSHYGYY